MMKSNCVATRGGHYLIDDGDGMGHVEDETGERIGPQDSMPLDSILARGYWKPTGVEPSVLPEVRE